METTVNYKQVSARIDQWLYIHKGESFDLDLLCRQLEIASSDGRLNAAKKLYYEISRGLLSKSNRTYRYIDSTYKEIEWTKDEGTSVLEVQFPFGRDDDSHFGFEGKVTIYSKDIIVLAGVSNTGKTCFCLNFLWDNMENFPCVLMGNEYSAGKFKRRVSRMTWAKPLKEDGTPKFILIERHSNWQDIIQPDSINIIDYLSLSGSQGEEFYIIGRVIEDIQSRLNKGLALIALQKDPTKTFGRGGSITQDLSSLYLSMDFGRLTVVKAKEWSDINPNHEIYGFDIVQGGTMFHNIRRIRKCLQCSSTGKLRGEDCERCHGSGYVDYPRQ